MDSPNFLVGLYNHGDAPDEWFAHLARCLLRASRLVIAGHAHRMLEVEFYLQSAAHRDPFAHAHPAQATCGRWYLHRVGEGYRGGSFKGMDITFGGLQEFGGILIRTLEAPDGQIINGSSLCVERALELTREESPASLDAALGERMVWDDSSPVHVVEARPEGPEHGEILQTARVGLTLKRAAAHPAMPAFIMAPYRFLTDPTIKKGKVHTIVALHQSGMEAADIARVVRSPAKSVRGYVEAYEAGASRASLAQWFGESLATRDVCVMHGAWAARYGAGPLAYR
ncbi:MAG: hypothetical protein AAGI01_04955 [Myxococcota bacterium]